MLYLLVLFLYLISATRICTAPGTRDELQMDVPYDTVGLMLARLGGCVGDCPCPETICELCRGEDDALAARVTTLEQEVSDTMNRQNGLFADVQTAQTDITSLESSTAQLDSELTSAQTDITSLQSSTTQLDSQLSTAQSDINTLEQQASQMSGDIQTLETQVSALDSRVTSVESSVSSLDTLTASLVSSVNVVGGHLAGNVTNLQSQIDNLEAQLGECCGTPVSVDLGPVESQTISGPQEEFEFVFPADAVNATLSICGAGGGGGTGASGGLGEGGAKGISIVRKLNNVGGLRLFITLGGVAPGGASTSTTHEVNGAHGDASTIHAENRLTFVANGGRGGMAGGSAISSANGGGSTGGSPSNDATGVCSGGGGGYDIGTNFSGGNGSPGSITISFQRAI